jgi:hypothetical protein
VRTRALLKTVVVALLVACTSGRGSSRPRIDVLPGISIFIPAGYCVKTVSGSGTTLYVVRQSPDAEDVASFSGGYQPDFPLDCSPAQRTEYTSNGLLVTEVRGTDGCAEFLFRLPPPHEHLGALHLWFDLGASNDRGAANAILQSVRPYSWHRGHSPTTPPNCDEVGGSPNTSFQRTSGLACGQPCRR